MSGADGPVGVIAAIVKSVKITNITIEKQENTH